MGSLESKDFGFPIHKQTLLLHESQLFCQKKTFAFRLKLSISNCEFLCCRTVEPTQELRELQDAHPEFGSPVASPVGYRMQEPQSWAY